MRRLRDRLGPWDRVRYLAWRVLSRRAALAVTLETGVRLALRPPPASDLDAAYEILISEVYHPPAGVRVPRTARRIVDLGANVGYAALDFLHRYPEARLVAFEPHPVHAAQLRRNLALNGWTDRVEVHEAAAGRAGGALYLTDAEWASRVVAEADRDPAPASPGGRDRLPIRVEDVFAALGPAPIDLLKIDIEGGEHALLEDPRFGALEVGALVIEWHNTEDQPDGRAAVVGRLASHGYAVATGPATEPVAPGGTNGVLWAVRGAGGGP